MMDADEKVGIALANMTARYPFFGAYCLRCDIREFDEEEYKMMEAMNGTATMATNGKRIMWGRGFVDEMTLGETMGVLMHEVLHIVYKHPYRRRHREPRKWNVANDYVIDPIILEASKTDGSGLTLPKPNGPDEHNHHELKYDGKSSEEVYELLPEIPSNYSSVGVVLDATNENGQPLSESEISAAEMEIDQLAIIGAEIQSRRKECGDLPGALAAHIKRLKEPKVDWQSALRRFVGGEQPDAHSMRRVHRGQYRMQGVICGTVEKKGVGELVIAIDTSGSVSDREVEQFLGEMNVISEEFMPTKITVIQCDSDVQKVDEYECGNIIDTIKVHGRGGTRVRPVFDYVEKHIEKVDKLIYMTDMGVCDWGEPVDYDVMWVGTVNTPAPWGDFVYIKIYD